MSLEHMYKYATKMCPNVYLKLISLCVLIFKSRVNLSHQSHFVVKNTVVQANVVNIRGLGQTWDGMGVCSPREIFSPIYRCYRLCTIFQAV